MAKVTNAPTTIGERIKDLREKKGETQEELKTALSVAKRETIAQWENDTRDIKTNYTVLLAEHFNVSTDYLLGRTSIETPDFGIQAIHEETGLSEKAIMRLKWCREQSKDNSITNAVNSLIENGIALDYIAKYLYYQLDDKAAVSFRYENIDETAWDSGNSVDPDSFTLLEDDIKKVFLLNVQAELMKMLKK